MSYSVHYHQSKRQSQQRIKSQIAKHVCFFVYHYTKRQASQNAKAQRRQKQEAHLQPVINTESRNKQHKQKKY